MDSKITAVSKIERSILLALSGATSRSNSFAAAVSDVRALLETHLDLHALVIDVFPFENGGTISVREGEFDSLFALTDVPYKAVYTVSLRAGGVNLGRLAAGFASLSELGDLPKRVAHFAGEQLGLVLERERLHDLRTAQERWLRDSRVSMSERKIVSRARGLLTAHHGMSEVGAGTWLAKQASKSGLTVAAIAERLLIVQNSPRLSGVSEAEERLSA